MTYTEAATEEIQMLRREFAGLEQRTALRKQGFGRAVQRVEKPFSARWQTVKKVPEAEQLAPVGVQRYGRARVATEVKILAEQAGLQQNRSLYVILRSAVTKNLSLPKCEDPSH